MIFFKIPALLRVKKQVENLCRIHKKTKKEEFDREPIDKSEKKVYNISCFYFIIG